MRAIARTARALDITAPGTAAKFPLPASSAEAAIVNAARIYLTSAQPIQADVVAYGLPAGFWTDLQTDLEHFEERAAQTDTATQGRIGATNALDNAVAASAKSVDALDAAVRNVFRGNSAKLAEWRHAKTIERGNIHRTPPAAPAVNPA